MFSKTFIYVLLLTCIYTYTIKTIKDNNDTDFKKQPYNYNFKSNNIKAGKLNLIVLKSFTKGIFGLNFASRINVQFTDLQYFAWLFDEELISQIKSCKTPSEMKKLYDSHMSKRLIKIFEYDEQKAIRDDFFDRMDRISDQKFFSISYKCFEQFLNFFYITLFSMKFDNKNKS